MNLITVSEGQKEKLEKHLKLGKDLKWSKEVVTDEKIAWLRKARALILMLDPNADKTGSGIVSLTYWYLHDDYHAIEKMTGEPGYLGEVAKRFEGALANFEAAIDCIEVAPESLIGSGSGVEINPYFFKLPETDTENLVFVLMPFSEPWSDRIWGKHIKPTIQGIEVEPALKCKRADDLYGHDVLLDIVSAIKHAKLVVADITSRNPNVFYELGISHCLGRPVILLTQSTDDIPFDLLRFRHIIYEDNSDGYEKLETQLKAATLEILA